MNNEIIRIRISKLLELYPYLESRAYTFMDTDAINTLIDINTAIYRAELDDLDLLILTKIYLEDMTQEQAVIACGITRDVVRYRTQKSLNRIGRAYYFPERYSRKGGK